MIWYVLLDNTFYVLKIPKYFALLWPSDSSRADFEGFQVWKLYIYKTQRLTQTRNRFNEERRLANVRPLHNWAKTFINSHLNFWKSTTLKNFSYTVFRHIVSAETIPFWNLEIVANSNSCRDISFYYLIKWFFAAQKLFKEGNYLRAETIWGNTVPYYEYL